MPRQVSRKDSQEIYYAYRIGVRKDGLEIFGEVKSCLAHVGDIEGATAKARYGSENDYDLRVIIDCNPDVLRIDQYTRIWVYATPIDSTTEPDYYISRAPQFRNGEIYLSCNKVAENSELIYFEYNGEILSTRVEFDYIESAFYTRPNMYLPIDENTKMWYAEPDDNDTQECLMTLESVENQGRRVAYKVKYGES